MPPNPVKSSERVLYGPIMGPAHTPSANLAEVLCESCPPPGLAVSKLQEPGGCSICNTHPEVPPGILTQP